MDDQKASATAAEVLKSSTAKKSLTAQKRLWRVCIAWQAQNDSQLSACVDELLRVWLDTATKEGWVYAERLMKSGATQEGWIPLSALQSVPETRSMKVWIAWHAADASQCSVQVGDLVKVWTESRTNMGWIYVQADDRTAGWLPESCLMQLSN